MLRDYSLKIISEDSLLVQWRLNQALPTPDDAAIIAALARLLIERHSNQIVNVAPAYHTLLVQFNVLTVSLDEIRALIVEKLKQKSYMQHMESSHRVHQIPTYYDVSVAPDLRNLCETKAISVAHLIEQHSSPTYTVYAVGFQPGFAYLGYVSELLATPRHVSFRPSVPAGSVGIADQQTAVYPMSSPGGWQIIGRTPMQMLENHYSVLRAGDEVRFLSIDRAEYLARGGTFELNE